MTREEIDIAVAEKVYGLRDVERRDYGVIFGYRGDPEKATYQHYSGVWPTSWEGMRVVLEVMAERGWWCRMDWMKHDWKWVEFRKRGASIEDKAYCNGADDLPTAVCLAALRAIESEEQCNVSSA